MKSNIMKLVHYHTNVKKIMNSHTLLGNESQWHLIKKTTRVLWPRDYNDTYTCSLLRSRLTITSYTRAKIKLITVKITEEKWNVEKIRKIGR